MIRWTLRPPLRGILPFFLTAERSQIEKCPHAAQRLDTSGRGEISSEDIAAVAHEDTEAVRLALIRRETEVSVEGIAGRGDPWRSPRHARLVRLDIREWRTRHQRKGGIAGAQMNPRELTDVVNEHGTARTTSRRPAVDAGGEHEMIKEQLRASVEQIEQTHLAAGAIEGVVLFDPHHR